MKTYPFLTVSPENVPAIILFSGHRFATPIPYCAVSTLHVNGVQLQKIPALGSYLLSMGDKFEV